jgi:hypothetical protein
MNTRLLFVSFVTLFFALGCNSDTDKTEPTQLIEASEAQSSTNAYTLIFIDKSASTTKYDQVQKQKHINELNRVANNLKKTGDYISLYYIDSYTKDGQDRLLNNKVNFKLELDPNKGEQTNNKKRDEYNRSLVSLQQGVREQLKHHFDSPKDKNKQNNTDLWDIFHILSKNIEGKENEDKVEVLIFSDMVESISGQGRRDFHKNELTSMNQAEDFANKDFVEIKKSLLLKDFKNPKRIRLKIYFPNDAKGRSYVEKYWETIFTKFGIDVAPTI